MKRAIAALVVVVLGAVCLDLAISWVSTGSLPDYVFFSGTKGSDGDVPRWRTIAFFLATLVGVLGGEIHRQAMTRPPATNIIRATLRSNRLIAGLEASPIVFGLVYVLVREHPDPLLSGVLAFENRFFWNTVLGPREAELTDEASGRGVGGAKNLGKIAPRAGDRD